MLARVLRAVLVLATMFVVLAMARPAYAAAASAPFCDDRGATALAPPPTLEAPDGAIQRARAEACGLKTDGDAWLAMFRSGRGRADASAASDGAAAAMTAASPAIVAADCVVLPVVETRAAPAAAPGSRLERPPRA
jgi:hypothetical protein